MTNSVVMTESDPLCLLFEPVYSSFAVTIFVSALHHNIHVHQYQHIYTVTATWDSNEQPICSQEETKQPRRSVCQRHTPHRCAMHL